MNSLDIIIVNWNAGKQLKDCLLSIIESKHQVIDLQRVIVVDNASCDNSLEGLEKLDLPLKIIRNDTNRGFAAACNQGAKGSSADYLLFLNPDTRLFADSLEKSIEYMGKAENQTVGILGIQLVDESGKVARTCARFPSLKNFLAKIFGLDRVLPTYFKPHLMSDWDHGSTKIVDHVIGAFLFVRRKLFEKLSGFDERFFVYLEDLDFSIRALHEGYTSVYLASAQAFHKGGGTSEQIKAKRLFYSLRSRILYAYKNFKKPSAVILTLATLFIEPFSRMLFGFIRLSLTEVIETIKAYYMLFMDILNINNIVKEGNHS